MNGKDIPQEILKFYSFLNCKKSYLVEPMRKTSVVESAFNEIAGIDSGPAT